MSEVALKRESKRETGIWIVIVLATSAAALAIAPVGLPAGYSWISQSLSESASQSTPGAWMARTGFLLFGSAVLVLAVRTRSWGVWGAMAHGLFGVLMMAAALFSHRPWLADLPVDETEDMLHSVAATAMGFAYAIGVTIVGFRRPNGRWKLLDILALASSILLPIGMGVLPRVAGLLQRAMFVVAYLWYGREALAGVAHASGDPVDGEK